MFRQTSDLWKRSKFCLLSCISLLHLSRQKNSHHFCYACIAVASPCDNFGGLAISVQSPLCPLGMSSVCAIPAAPVWGYLRREDLCSVWFHFQSFPISRNMGRYSLPMRLVTSISRGLESWVHNISSRKTYTVSRLFNGLHRRQALQLRP